MSASKKAPTRKATAKQKPMTDDCRFRYWTDAELICYALERSDSEELAAELAYRLVRSMGSKVRYMADLIEEMSSEH